VLRRCRNDTYIREDDVDVKGFGEAEDEAMDVS
jgi:hypothetical protein